MAAALLRLGARVKELRRERGLTQEATATKAGLDVKHIQAIEAGDSNVTTASLVGLARAFETTLAELLLGV